ncbi:hypothetical protein HNW77_04570 [Komagataeibacter sp. AV436]|uniref:Uncharacterized protein n=2 Tax=Komagataeibacter TaxID=1434011 RepID=A0ABX2ABE3_9PROT|nr:MULTISPECIES: hypothetical protein [Komagataeibacter]MBV1830229.1 hypothetical protein [Komagataeibacter melomenusus]MCK9821195.1 hypothetical protein [Komagataeibacter oboediens]NPC65681.1 hypothetical protein [Komagataeibacter melomenusus]
MNMHGRTVRTLEQLDGVVWFRSVGQGENSKIILLSSWAEALESCQSVTWKNVCLEAANQYRERLLERNIERYRKWNEIVREVEPYAEELVKKKTKEVVQNNNLPESFIRRVNFNIVGLCMECEYADLYPPGFSAGLAYWYMDGHFPCGWDGDFPEGKLKIF